MTLPFWFVVGVWLTAVEGLLRARFDYAPDVRALLLALLLLRPAHRRDGVRFIAVLLGFSTLSPDPLGAALLGGGVAALFLVGLREMVFVESPGTQALYGGFCALSFASARFVYSLFLLGPRLEWSATVLATPLLTAAAAPILQALAVALGRVGARLRIWIEGLRARGPGGHGGAGGTGRTGGVADGYR